MTSGKVIPTADPAFWYDRLERVKRAVVGDFDQRSAGRAASETPSGYTTPSRTVRRECL